MSTFQERKAERKAAGQKNYEFNVVATFPFDGEVVRTFKSRREADDFAFKQVSVFVCDTQARRALCARFPKSFISTGQTFKIERVEA